MIKIKITAVKLDGPSYAHFNYEVIGDDFSYKGKTEIELSLLKTDTKEELMEYLTSLIMADFRKQKKRARQRQLAEGLEGIDLPETVIMAEELKRGQ